MGIIRSKGVTERRGEVAKLRIKAGHDELRREDIGPPFFCGRIRKVQRYFRAEDFVKKLDRD